MKTSCSLCLKTDERDLSAWVRLPDVGWAHAACIEAHREAENGPQPDQERKRRP